MHSVIRSKMSSYYIMMLQARSMMAAGRLAAAAAAAGGSAQSLPPYRQARTFHSDAPLSPLAAHCATLLNPAELQSDLPASHAQLQPSPADAAASRRATQMQQQQASVAGQPGGHTGSGRLGRSAASPTLAAANPQLPILLCCRQQSWPARCSAFPEQQQQQPVAAAAPSRRQLLGVAAAALAAAALPAGPAAAESNVLDGQGQTFLVPGSEVENFTAAKKQLLEYNLRTQRQNNAPLDFPAFIREGCAACCPPDRGCDFTEARLPACWPVFAIMPAYGKVGTRGVWWWVAWGAYHERVWCAPFPAPAAANPQHAHTHTHLLLLTPLVRYDMTVVADGYVQSPEGLIYKDFVEGAGEFPSGDQVRADPIKSLYRCVACACVGRARGGGWGVPHWCPCGCTTRGAYFNVLRACGWGGGWGALHCRPGQHTLVVVLHWLPGPHLQGFCGGGGGVMGSPVMVCQGKVITSNQRLCGVRV